MIAVTSLLLLCAGSTLGAFLCPDDGFYADDLQCDKYYDCYRGKMEEKLCPDGLVFDHSLSPRVEQCNYPFLVACPETSIQQLAIPSGIECPRQNGYFEHEDPANCLEYYECTGGIAVRRNCHTGLVFDEFTGACAWGYLNIRQGCSAQQNLILDDGFQCPNSTQIHTNGQALDHARYLKEDDCRHFYVCKEGVFPSLVGCPEGTVFNDVTLLCDTPENVVGCENYYGPPVAQKQGNQGNQGGKLQ